MRKKTQRVKDDMKKLAKRLDLKIILDKIDRFELNFKKMLSSKVTRPP